MLCSCCGLLQVFSAPEWAALGFMVVDPSLKGADLIHLKVQDHPPGPRLVNLLKSNPPPTEDIARQWFTTLASRVTGRSCHCVVESTTTHLLYSSSVLAN